ncbi:ABC transporter substrate-binding protein [Verminephrobacter eiseniae]|uniref:Extracellular solute-binding protein, family 3 n=1 Tax=Verminephrobacter eiseniae (strain EF01-2) TaxID=391735 RepID=A1WEC2_VEREI|nr:ABC transporter substrate-binding protein [Verminephrobacter eiseniae]ABM55979.1 extracellular solute-binding protein, family 3 [Verminephrobacter eiseniae EF01-2]MCW5286352.1 amino acid ABC transporter substrate-binding protein [Verminephrobacter eiseniae]MCW5304651.1 amino acid ABC transporter substrate-binding protein [Verminephrobacter eiseniae]MCW8180233.1 amino acid ABC transporter substrate-binding protein [Verminephrobacter eiseniae]MCW8191904.1 amino acid ABC transporter substrate-
MKPASRLAALLLATLTMACGGQASAQAVLKVGSTPTGNPFTFLDTKTNTIDGLMADIVKAVGKTSGFAVQIEPMQFSALIGSLTSGRIDLISAAMFITPVRQQVVDFSQPIYSYGEGIVVPVKDGTAYRSFSEFKGKRMGVQVGTAFVEPLHKLGIFSEVKLYDTTADLMRDANAGRIDAGVLDYPIAAYAISRNLFPNLRMATTYQPTMVNDIGIATRKGDTETMAKVNAALTKLKADGSIDAILKKWGLNH